MAKVHKTERGGNSLILFFFYFSLTNSIRKKTYITLLYYNMYIGTLILLNWFFLPYEDITTLETMLDHWSFKEEKMRAW